MLGAGVVVAVAIAVVAGLVAYGHGKSAPKSSAVDAVRKAYLAYSAAIAQEVDQQSITPVRPYLTDAGASQEEQTLSAIKATGNRYDVTYEHSPQIVVHSSSRASVDDLEVRHTTQLSPTPTTSTDVLHVSVVFSDVGGHWLVDSSVAFGTAAPEPGFSIAYAAAARGQSPDPLLLIKAQQLFASYWTADAQSLRNLDPSPLGVIEEGPLLQQDQQFISRQRQEGRAYELVVSHNPRFAEQDTSTLWAYDTYLDSSYYLESATGKTIEIPSPEVLRESYEFKLINGTWRLESSTEFK